MKTILINKEGYVASPYTHDADIPLTITDEQAEMISTYKFNYNWRYVDGKFVQELLATDDVLRYRREAECFRIIYNRSQLWYNHLTVAQKNELDAWYEAWLHVTETRKIPEKPDWLK